MFHVWTIHKERKYFFFRKLWHRAKELEWNKWRWQICRLHRMCKNLPSLIHNRVSRCICISAVLGERPLSCNKMKGHLPGTTKEIFSLPMHHSKKFFPFASSISVSNLCQFFIPGFLRFVHFQLLRSSRFFDLELQIPLFQLCKNISNGCLHRLPY